MNLSVTKENLNILTLDLSSEIEANGGGDLSFFIELFEYMVHFFGRKC